MNARMIDECTNALDKESLFVSTDHRSRFNDLMHCYFDFPFFHKGLCKCMYLSAWDMEHYLIIMDILNDMTLGRSRDTEEMSDNGITLEEDSTGYDRYVFQMSAAFLENRPYEIPDEPIEELGLKILTYGLKASAIIDEYIE